MDPPPQVLAYDENIVINDDAFVGDARLVFFRIKEPEAQDGAPPVPPAAPARDREEL
jgi:hypothetical protein